MPPGEESRSGRESPHEVAARIHLAGGGLGPLLAAVADETKSLLRADHAFVWLFDTSWGDLYGRRSAEEEEFRFPLGAGLAGRVAKTRKPLRTANAPEEPGYVGETDSSASGSEPAFMAVPLLGENDRLIGVLEALASGDREFDDDDQRDALALARHVAAALARSVEREQERRFLLDLTASLADSVDRRSPWTLDHSYRVREYCRLLGRAAGLDADRQFALELAALLHGVGRSEMETQGGTVEAARGGVKTNVVFAEAVLRTVRFPEYLADVPEIVLYCLRSGTGPAKAGKGRAEPSALARMLRVADAYDVFLHGRDGGAGEEAPLGESAAVEQLRKGAGTLFDAECVRLFLEHRCHAIEHRRFPRIDYETPVDVTVLGVDGEEERRFRTKALDLSEGGILLRSEERIEPGTPLRLAIGMPSGGMAAIARVARVLPGEGAGCRIGVYFLWYGTADS